MVIRLKPRDIDGAPVAFKDGELEVWYLDEEKEAQRIAHVVDDTVGWLHDEKTIVVTRLLDHQAAEELDMKCPDRSAECMSAYVGWASVPVVSLIDIETGSEMPMHVGEHPIVSSDGQQVLVRDVNLRWRIVDINTKHCRAVSGPGAIYPGSVALLNKDLVVYWAWPTAGRAAQYTKYDSPVVGSKQMRCIKICNLDTGGFQTLVDDVDPRSAVSVGTAIECK
jgi:hypothetical protein